MDRRRRRRIETSRIALSLAASILTVPFSLDQSHPARAADYAAPVNALRSQSAATNSRALLAFDPKNWLQDTVETSTKHISQDPRDVGAYMRRADAYDRLNQLELSISDYSKVIELDPQNADAYQKRARLYWIQKRLDLAISDCNTAISLDPTYAAAFVTRGHALQDTEHHEEAIRDFTQAIALDPQESNSYSNRSESYRKLGKPELAEADYRRSKSFYEARRGIEGCNAAISNDPDNVGLYYIRAELFDLQKQLKGALEDLTRIISLQPAAAEAYFLRGRIWSQLRNPENAIADFNAAIKLDPNGVQARRWKGTLSSDGYRGLVYKARGNAIVERCHHDTNTAYVGREGELRRDLDMAGQGLQMFKFGTEGYETSSRLKATMLDALSQTQNATEEYRKSIQDYSTAISLDDKDADAYEKRANLYEEMHDPYKAVHDYDAAITLRAEPVMYTVLALLFIRRARCYTELRQTKSAIADYTAVIEGMSPKVSTQAEPSNSSNPELRDWQRRMDKLTVSVLATAYINRGKLYRQLGQNGNAQVDLAEGYRLDPSKAEFDSSLDKRRGGMRR